MNYLLLLFDATLVILLSTCIANFFNPDKMGKRIILGWLIFNGILVLSGYVLSLLSLLSSPLSWMALHLIACIVLFPLLRPIPSPITTVVAPAYLLQSWRSISLSLKITLLLLILLFFIIVSINIICPIPMNDDSIDYHLPRVGYYLSQGSLAAFATNDLRQIGFPLNAELIYIWIIGFTKDFRVIYLYQWVTLLSTCLGVYAVCRILDFSPKISSITSFYWLAIPLVITQAVVIKNDIVVTFYSIAALVFLLSIHKSPISSILGISLSVSLAIGTKYNGLLSAFGILASLSFYLLVSKEIRRYSAHALIILIFSTVLLGSYSYLTTFFRTGSPLVHFGQASSFQPTFFVINSLRLLVEMTDSVAVLNEDVAPKLNLNVSDVREPLFRVLAQIPYLNIFDESNLWKSSYYTNYTMGLAKYEFNIGAFLLLFGGLLYSLRRKLRNIEIQLILLAFLFGYIPQVCLLSWQNHNLRFYLPLLIVLFPLSAFVVQWIFSKRVVGIFINLCYGFGLFILVYFYARFRLMDCIDKTPQQTFYDWINEPQSTRELIEFLHPYPSDMPIAIHGSTISYELLLMGFDFQREVIPIPKAMSEEDIHDLFLKHNNLQMLITSSSFMGTSQYRCIPINSSLNAILETKN